ncbi:MAG: phosphoglycerate dehydrogenase [Truepera sp.]|nr:phosphoglycerate dehydrogenase [Truepera sp.]
MTLKTQPPVVLISPETMRDWEGPHVGLLQGAGFEVRYSRDPRLAQGNLSERDTVEELRGVGAVIARGEVFSDGILSALPELRVIARAGVGYDRVDIASATRHGVAVTITPTANHASVAEHTLALVLAVARSIIPIDRQTRAGHWPLTQPQPLRGRTLGIFGLGRIGRSVAIRARAFEMSVLATEAYPDCAFISKHEIELVDFSTLLARSDVVSLHCPLTETTRGLFDRQAFARMKAGSVFINTARGPLVVEEDLVEALRSGRLAAAGVDVFEQEPATPDNPLLELDNVVVSSHRAGNDTRSVEDMGIEAARSIVDLYRGRWPSGAVVNDELREGWRW